MTWFSHVVVIGVDGLVTLRDIIWSHPPMAELRSFKRPPVIETVLGVQFDPLPAMTNAHLGLFWELLGAEWPHVTDVMAIEQQFERFGEEQLWAKLGMLRFKISQET